MRTDDVVEVLKIIRKLKAMEARLPEAKERLRGAVYQLTNLVPHEHLALIERDEVANPIR
jgi:hypothetical protein